MRVRHFPTTRRLAAFTLVEAMLALLVVLVAVGGTLSTLSTFARLGSHSEQRSLAIRAAEQRIERLHAEDFALIFARYNEVPADDPVAVVSPGSGFAVLGLDAVQGDADGLPGRVRFPVDPGAPGVLREDLDDPAFGTPLDLDMDEAVDAANHAGDYARLPVRVEVTWRGPAGEQTIHLDTTLTPR